MSGATITSNLEDDAAILFDAVRAAGALALEYFGGDIKQWDKGDDDPVSEADHAVNDLLHEKLRGARPKYAWLSEESEDDLSRHNARFTWVVDPIDGTRAFLKHEPQFTVTVALVENGAAVAGVIFNPATDEFYEAVKGTGGRLNGSPITIGGSSDFANAKLLAPRKPFQKANWSEVIDHAEFQFVNSMAYRMALVADGRFDATVTLSRKNDWDIAAGILIVEEAGGVVTHLDGSAIILNQSSTRHPDLVIANRVLHEEIIERLGD